MSDINLPILELPSDNADRCLLLKLKLEEYQKRMGYSLPQVRGNGCAFMAPEALNEPANFQKDTRHKMVVLERLLEHGKIATQDLSRELAQEPWYDAGLFENACHVIADYVKTGGKNVFSGTGLKAR